MIPKVIHYIWLGGKEKSALTVSCINTWRRVLTNYEIKEWNETNLPIDELRKKNKFLDQCFRLKLWAYVSDYLRLYILFQEGGIYLDTDVEVLKKFDDCLLYKTFLGMEYGGICTGVIGSEKHSNTIKSLLDFYEQEIWNQYLFINPQIFLYVKDNVENSFDECKIFPMETFAPYEPGKTYNSLVETNDTVAIHWYAKNWNMHYRGYLFLTTKHIKNPFKKSILLIKRTLGYFIKVRS